MTDELKARERNNILDEVMPKIRALIGGQIVVAGLVNFETIQKAINDLKDTRPSSTSKGEASMTDELKACPFCGFRLDINDDDCLYPIDHERTLFSINCYETGGGCSANILGRTPEECVKLWNTRTSTSKGGDL